MKVCLAILFLILLVGACKTPAITENVDSNIKQFIISPKEVSPQFRKNSEDYVVFQPSKAKAQRKLFLFLPGSLVAPRLYGQLLLTAAKNGFYSIGLSYPNNRTQTARCKGEGSDCQGKVSREILEGKDYTDIVTVSRQASIEGRLIALLHYLQEKHPDRDWGKFLRGNMIQWKLITVAGHSQGSNHAAYIGWHRTVAGVGMFSGPRGIADEKGVLADWLQDNRKTPASRFYGFGNVNDHITDFLLMQAAWDAMGLCCKTVSVDEQHAPYQESHQLFTSEGRSGLFNGGHGSTCVDAQTPMDSNDIPKFKVVWEYMLFR